MTVTDLLRALDSAEISVKVRGGNLALSPRSRLTPEIQAEILRHRPALLALFRDPPSWPPARGRSGPLPEGWRHNVGDSVRLLDGREGRLRALEYDTRSGRLRLYVEFGEGKRVLLDPEDLASTATRRTA